MKKFSKTLKRIESEDDCEYFKRNSSYPGWSPTKPTPPNKWEGEWLEFPDDEYCFNEAVAVMSGEAAGNASSWHDDPLEAIIEIAMDHHEFPFIYEEWHVVARRVDSDVVLVGTINIQFKITEDYDVPTKMKVSVVQTDLEGAKKLLREL